MPTFHCSKWPGCKCPTGTVIATCPGLNDRRNVIVHQPIEGEGLRNERLGGPCPVSPSHFINALAVAVILIAIGAALYAANAAAGIAQ